MSTKTIAIVGGGFAGAKLAQRLERRLPADWSIVLLSRDNFITFNPLLPEVVGASLLPGHVVAPLRQIATRTRVCMVQVTGIDLAAKTISYLGEGSGQVPYDELVLACGQGANLAIVKGMARYALPLKTLGDSLFMRNRAIVRLEQAELQTDPELRRWLTTFIVIGGGFSGVETAGGLADFLRASRRYYPSLGDTVRVHLVHGADCLLPELSASLGRFAEREMRRQGIEVHLNARAVRVDGRGILLADGTSLTGGTIICTIGTAPNPLIAELPFRKDRGRIETAPDMSVPGFAGVWAIGDCAAVPNAATRSLSPPTAQFADRQACQLADNLLRRIRSMPTRPFAFRPLGQLSAIGHNKAVAELGGVRIAGFVAWLLWRGVYLLKIPTLSRKVRLFLEWNWAMFFPPDIAHLGYVRTRRTGPQAADSAPAAASTERAAA